MKPMLGYCHVIVERLLRKNGRQFMALLLMLGMAHASLAQNARTITGRVTDDASKDPIPGASVVLKGTTIGTATTAEGTFSLNLPAGTNQVLVISSIGYATQEVAVGAGPLNISLKTASSTLSDVVVVGYGTQKRGSLTGAVSTVTAKDLEGKPVTSAVQALQGAAPNLIIQQNATEPGAAININVRGVSTVNNSSPLILVDGVPGSLDLLNPNDIESISVLKDAASSAIYGSRAANGVILVTTKKGKASKIPRVTYNGIMGAQQPTFLIKPVSGVEYMQLKNEALVNSGQNAQFSPEQIRLQGEKGSEGWWMDEVMRSAALQHNHNLGVSGAVGKVNYLVSGGYLDQNSLYRGPDYGYKRYNGRANLSTQLGKLKLGGNFAYAKQKIREHAYYSDWLISTAIRIPTIYPIKDADGKYFLAPTASNNPLAQLEQGGRRLYNNDSYNYMANAEYAITKHLSAKVVYGADIRVNNMDEFRKSIDYAPYSGSDNQSSRTVNHARSIQDNFQAMLNYERTFNGKHEVKGMLGYATEGWKNEYDQTRRLNVDNITGDSTAGTQTLTGFNDTYGTRIDQWALNSGFGRFNYAYDNKYYFEFNFRYDASSRFAKGNRGAFFPSFSAAWRITDEPFMESVKEKVGDLKLRGSWGQLGNQQIISNYGYLNVYTTVSNMYGFNNLPQSGSSFAVGNPVITWESANSANIGFDLSMLDNRLTISYDYFHKITDNILLQLPAPGLYGATPAFQNAGKVKNQGYEIAVNYRARTGDFNHTIGANLADNLNEIVDFKGRTFIQEGDVTYINREGFPISSYYGYQADGFYQSLEDIKNSPKPSFVNEVKPGDIKYVDRNGDGIIDNRDRFVMGNPFPRFTFGLNYSVNWKGFDASIFIQGVGKRNVYLRGEGVEAFHNNWDNVYSQHIDRWTPNNPNADYPRLTIGTASVNNNANSTFWLENAAYARLKNAQIGYTLPASFTNKAKIQKMRIYLTGQNLFTVTGMKNGMDPELTEFNSTLNLNALSSSTSGRIYPVQKVWAVGLDINF
ncbi:TonB-dependent receptor [uncultured Chitinophaga sp.]|uniref:SusC/RagA family TonB-linked outer membrane protein n=3 Tax=Chitinophaga TaxID=79328 RepID=UPI0026394161|nr:TonB-dependent receptor [uncultured Chitinophaga sp.]